MRTFYIVKGKKDDLVGDPTAPGRFVGQRKVSFKPGEMPQRLLDRYEPEYAAAPKSPHMIKAIARGQFEASEEVVAKDLAEARAKARAKNPPPPKDTRKPRAKAKTKPKPATAPKPQAQTGSEKS